MDNYLRGLQRRAYTGSVEDKDKYIGALERIAAGNSALELPKNVNDPEYGWEVALYTAFGTQIRIEAFVPTSYIRVVEDRDDNKEIAYWTLDEIVESPSEVIHAIIGYAQHGKIYRCVYCNLHIYDARNASGSEDVDWATLTEDFGCENSPYTNDEGTGNHVPVL